MKKKNSCEVSEFSSIILMNSLDLIIRTRLIEISQRFAKVKMQFFYASVFAVNAHIIFGEYFFVF